MSGDPVATFYRRGGQSSGETSGASRGQAGSEGGEARAGISGEWRYPLSPISSLHPPPGRSQSHSSYAMGLHFPTPGFPRIFSPAPKARCERGLCPEPPGSPWPCPAQSHSAVSPDTAHPSLPSTPLPPLRPPAPRLHAEPALPLVKAEPARCSDTEPPSLPLPTGRPIAPSFLQVGQHACLRSQSSICLSVLLRVGI